MKAVSLVYYFLVICFLSLSFPSFGASISGTVVDAETKEPLPYASIGVLGTTKGTVSNSEGIFMLDLEGTTPNDMIVFRYMGYEPVKLTISSLQAHTEIRMRPAAVSLREVEVSTYSLPAEEIIRRAYKNFESNSAAAPDKQRIFVHKYSKIPFQKENKVKLKESDFVGLDKKTFDEIMKKMPPEFIEYQDALVEYYHNGNNYKLVPIKGISLEEGSQQKILDDVENKLADFTADIEKSMGEKDIYYKLSTGILSKKVGNKNKDKEAWNKEEKKEEDADTLNYTIPTEQAKDYLQFLLKQFVSIKSDEWKCINSTNKYEYELKDIPLYNNERVYQITFRPKKRGLYEGTVYIATGSFAILQADFAFAKGKKSDSFNLFGFKHVTNFKEAHLIFEKGKSGYFIKYMSATQKDFTSLDRNFSVVKKQKRFLIDKQLNEMKFDVELFFNTENQYELLVLDREEISTTEFEKVKEPAVMKFKKEFAYTPEMWDNRTVIVPTSELKKYKRK
ncbi:MAG TPA: carboxypeptidase-like regulatory domain-containing protein [Cytophagaceae bacterium]|nr:carboxypeptidase-like regulatory domain-containing protein [Cytophagaceae bacterium]